MKLRALVLAAGEGRRLRPLTEHLPKPLLPVLGRTLLDRTLERLAAVGCEAVAVNLHHLADAVAEAAGERAHGMPVTLSREPRLLGTWGAVGALTSFLSAADGVLLVNGDSLCRWPLAALVETHRRRAPAATLLLAAGADPEHFGGGVRLAADGRVLALRGPYRDDRSPRRVFAGAHLLEPSLIGTARPVASDIVSALYEPLLAAGATLCGHLTRRRWHDLGTPDRYLAAVLDELAAQRPPGGSWSSPTARVDARSELRRSAVEAGAEVEAGARVSRSLLLPGARVGARCRLREVIVGPGVALVGGSVETRVLLTAGPRGTLQRRPLGEEAC